MKIYKVLMFGDRRWSNYSSVGREVVRLKRKAERMGCELVVISGKAAGADSLAIYEATSRDVHVCEVPALWETRHRGAGPQRNEIMKLLEPAEGICFHRDLVTSRGSADMKRRLDKAGVPVKVVIR